MSSFIAAQRLNRMRGYFAVVGVLGSLAVVMELGLVEFGTAWSVLLIALVPVLVAYLVAAVAFHRLLMGPWLTRIALSMAAWSIALAVYIGSTSSLDKIIPVTLFLIIPALGTWMKLQDVREGR